MHTNTVSMLSSCHRVLSLQYHREIPLDLLTEIPRPDRVSFIHMRSNIERISEVIGRRCITKRARQDRHRSLATIAYASCERYDVDCNCSSKASLICRHMVQQSIEVRRSGRRILITAVTSHPVARPTQAVYIRPTSPLFLPTHVAKRCYVTLAANGLLVLHSD